jgi:hypothetical protein
MFSVVWTAVKNWALGEGKDVCVILLICGMLLIFVRYKDGQEAERYKQIMEISESSRLKEIQVLKDTYNEQIKALSDIDKKYQVKLDGLVKQYQDNLVKINEKQEELYKMYSQNVDVLKLALKEVFALEEGK